MLAFLKRPRQICLAALAATAPGRPSNDNIGSLSVQVRGSQIALTRVMIGDNGFELNMSRRRSERRGGGGRVHL